MILKSIDDFPHFNVITSFTTCEKLGKDQSFSVMDMKDQWKTDEPVMIHWLGSDNKEHMHMEWTCNWLSVFIHV